MATLASAWDSAAQTGASAETKNAVIHTATALALLATAHSNYRKSWGLLAAKAESWLAAGPAKSVGCGEPSDCVNDADLTVVRWSDFASSSGLSASSYGGSRFLSGW